MNAKRTGNPVQIILSYSILILLSLAVLVPLAWAVSTSIKPTGQIFTIPPRWIPPEPTFNNYLNVIYESSIPRYFINSLAVGILTTVFSLTLGGLAGYGFARYTFRGKQAMSLFVLSTQMLPLIVFMIPLYFLVSRLGLLDTIWGLSLSHLVLTMPLVTWMARSYFATIPKELEDAARIDGCSHFQAFLLVVLPLAGPGIAATGVYSFIMSWNEFVLASVLTTTPASKTLPIGLSEFSTQFSVDWGGTMAAVVLISLPVILLFLWLQKYFVSGLSQGAVKG